MTDQKYKPTKKEKKASEAMYVRDKPLVLHKSGNSNVLTIPSELPYEAGDEFVISQVEDGLFLKPVENDKNKEKAKIDRQLREIDDISGTFNTPGIEKMTAKDIENVLEGIYD